MKGELRAFSLEGRPCACCVPQGEGPFPLLVLCGWGLEEKLPLFAQELPPVVLFTAQADGGRDFTPWPAPGVREGEAFTGEAGDYLGFLTERALPLLERDFCAAAQPQRRGILGYSLGGLFALWAQRQGEVFRLAGSLSGSLWYPGWLGYMEQHPPRPGACVYLSLGDREEFGGPPWGTAPAGPTPFIRKRAWTPPWSGTRVATAKGWTPAGKRPCAGPRGGLYKGPGACACPLGGGADKKTRKIPMKFSIQYLFKEV